MAAGQHKGDKYPHHPVTDVRLIGMFEKMGQKTGTPEIGHFRFSHRHRRPADLHRHMRIFDQAGRIFFTRMGDKSKILANAGNPHLFARRSEQDPQPRHSGHERDRPGRKGFDIGKLQGGVEERDA